MHQVQQERFNRSLYINSTHVNFKYLFHFHAKLFFEYFINFDVEMLTLQIHSFHRIRNTYHHTGRFHYDLIP